MFVLTNIILKLELSQTMHYQAMASMMQLKEGENAKRQWNRTGRRRIGNRPRQRNGRGKTKRTDGRIRFRDRRKLRLPKVRRRDESPAGDPMFANRMSQMRHVDDQTKVMHEYRRMYHIFHASTHGLPNDRLHQVL